MKTSLTLKAPVPKLGGLSLKAVFLGLALCCQSCSFFIRSSGPQEEDYEILPQTEKTICGERDRKKSSFISSNESANTAFEKFMEVLAKKRIDLNFVELSVLWSLVQMNARPDQTSPSSRLQFLLRIDGRQEFMDVYYHPAMDQLNNLKNSLSAKGPGRATVGKAGTSFLPFPFFFGLEQLLQKAPRSRGLLQLAQLLEKNFPFPLVVEEGLKGFLDSYQSSLMQDNDLRKYYFKDDELLKTSESLPVPPYAQLVQWYREEMLRIDPGKVFHIKKTLTPYVGPDKAQVSCNVDLSTYEHSLDASDDKPLLGNVFGFQDQDGNSFLAVSNQDFSELHAFKKTFLIKGRQDLRPIPLCLYNSDQAQISLVSNQDRDPSQHLFHLLKKGLGNPKSVGDFDQKIKDARFLFLPTPMRLVFESRRGSKKQVQKLLMLDVPLYHSPNLGNIWSHIYLKEARDYGFIIDDRNSGSISCL